jgi:uncharacterized protein YndB with AHSA1/START domain
MAPLLARSVRISRRFRAPAERVFDAWLDEDVAGRWLFATALRPMAHVEIDARVGGSFRFVDTYRNVEHTGEYREIARPRRLAFTLSLERSTTRMTVEIFPGRRGCTLALTHENLPRHRAREVADRWCGMLYGLDETLESLPFAVASRVRPTSHPTPAYRSAP